MVEEGGYFCNISEKRGKFIYICVVFVFIKVLCSWRYFKFWWSLLVRLKRNKIKINVSIYEEGCKILIKKERDWK